jgi:xanthine/uracil/vitamin C permease (AzgA family)
VTFWNGVVWLHLLGMAFFVGGQLMLAAVVVPALRDLPDGAPLRVAARRFGIGTVIAFVVLIASGAALAGHEHKWGDSTLHVKMALVAVVGVLIAAHMRWPASHVLDGLVFAVSLAIVWLGIVVGD